MDNASDGSNSSPASQPSTSTPQSFFSNYTPRGFHFPFQETHFRDMITSEELPPEMDKITKRLVDLHHRSNPASPDKFRFNICTYMEPLPQNNNFVEVLYPRRSKEKYMRHARNCWQCNYLRKWFQGGTHSNNITPALIHGDSNVHIFGEGGKGANYFSCTLYIRSILSTKECLTGKWYTVLRRYIVLPK